MKNSRNSASDRKSSSGIFCALVPAVLLALSVGQIYAFTVFADEIAAACGRTGDKSAVQFAFSLGIFFLGMGAAFFGKIVEKNIKLSTAIGTAMFVSGLAITSWGIKAGSLAAVHIGYGFFTGVGTGIIYITPVKTMMLWFERHKALAAAVPIISFGLGSSVCTLLYKGFSAGSQEGIFLLRFGGLQTLGASGAFLALAAIYAVPMTVASFLIRKPASTQATFAEGVPALEFSYLKLLSDTRFLRMWLFMFLNISCGLFLIPLAQQLMGLEEVGYSRSLSTAVLTAMGLMNGAGRFLFAWWSDRLATRVNILLIILGISAGVMLASLAPVLLALALVVISACYGAGFSTIPAVLADHYGMSDISKIHGAVLSAWGIAGLAGNQTSLWLFRHYGLTGLSVALAALYLLNAFNVLSFRKSVRTGNIVAD